MSSGAFEEHAAIEFFLVMTDIFLSRRCRALRQRARESRESLFANRSMSLRLVDQTMSSFVFRRSLTTCGLAFPPVDFMT